MVRGLESFREWFKGNEKQYTIIGGTACDILMAEEGLSFRATKDIDLVVLVEAVDADFGEKFWKYVKAAGYEHCNMKEFVRRMKNESIDLGQLGIAGRAKTDILAELERIYQEA